MPLVSVLLPINNAANDLPRAINSLLNQTFQDFEVIAIDDGSTDGSVELLDQYASLDRHIRVFHQPNAGALSKVLNRAAELALGQYLARQDADDASTLTRLEEQIHYMDTHPKVGVCGTWNWHIDSQFGPLFSSELPDDHTLLLRFLKKGKNPFVHGSVMMRTNMFRERGGYRGSLVEDFDLWLRMSEITQLGMHEKMSYYYWHSAGGISSGAHIRQQKLVKLALKLHEERARFGCEVTNWETEYQQISNMHFEESNPDERKTFMHYARSIHLMRIKRWEAARAELTLASAGQGQYARKARRNLSLFGFAPVVATVYHLIETQEPQHYARNIPAGTPLPEFLQS